MECAVVAGDGVSSFAEVALGCRIVEVAVGAGEVVGDALESDH